MSIRECEIQIVLTDIRSDVVLVRESLNVQNMDDGDSFFCHAKNSAASRTGNGRDSVKIERAVSLLDEDNGYFAILSSQFKDPAEAMIACELRYTTENFFSDLQNDEDCYRLDVYTPHNLYVRVFIQFIAQILRSYLRRVINQNHEKLPWGQPAHAVLWEIDSLQQVETVDGRHFYRDATPMQEQILDMFGIDIRKSR